jgi:hypothetical protein
MKSIFAVLLFVTCSGTNAFAQEKKVTNEKNIQVGLSLVSVNQHLSLLTINRNTYAHFINGVNIKQQRKHVSYRGAIYHQFNAKKNEYYQENQKYIFKPTEARLGIEKSFFNSKVKPYVAIDAVFTYLKYSIDYDFSDARHFFIPGGSMIYDVTTRHLAYGVSPTIGLSWQFHKHFSVHAEANTNILLRHTTSETKDYSSRDKRWVRTHVVLQTLSVNFHF